MNVPGQMRYIEMRGSGDVDVLHLTTGPLPVPKADEVLIHVEAAGLNRPDVAQRMGAYPVPAGASPILGLEVAGVVVARGANARHYNIGDRVCALTNGGGYAEYCVAPEAQSLPWPQGYDAVRAAALPETYFTVWANLFQLGKLVEGERVLVHGASSGIGVTAVQLARTFGAEVFATAGSEEKCAACLELGATAAINYRTTDFAVRVSELTRGQGVDVVLDMVGAPYFERNLQCLRMDGRLVLIAFLEGSKVGALDLMPLMLRRLTVTGSTMRPRTTAQKGAIAQQLLSRVWPLLESGRCGPVIHSVFSMSAARDAHGLMESSKHIGKIVLRVDP
jgi:NADPH:quinone reductase